LRISHYELIQPIGRDGASEIYRARDLRLERDVAVKLLRLEEAARPGAVELFHREARIASLVSHPHVCAVHDSGIEGGRPFLVLEFLEGRALDELIAGSPLAITRVFDISMQIAEALGAAHRRGIIHGNLKPSNVFITNDGQVKLLELGAASAATPAAPPAAAAHVGSVAHDVARFAESRACAGRRVPHVARTSQRANRGSDDAVAGRAQGIYGGSSTTGGGQ
jgi:serine/threonine protein kinase